MPDHITPTGSSAFARRGRRSPATPETDDGRPSPHDIPVPSDETAHSDLDPWNPGTPLELDWLRHLRVNRSAAERRAASLPGRRSVKRDWQAAWLLRAVTCIDLTTLAGDDTPGRVRRFCGKARNPVRADLLEAAGASGLPIQVASVCVYPSMVATAVEALAGSEIPVAAVAAGFPAGQTPFPARLDEIRTAVAAGASEIDIVISREHVLRGRWGDLYDEVGAFREAARGAHLKTIIATGELATLTNVARASLVCMMAGADFIKTSTGKEKVNATLPVGLTMVRQIRAWRERTGYRVGFKPAGGISTAKQALVWLVLMREELGPRWMQAGLFRFGASSLLGDIERQIEHYVTGRYSATHRHPTA
ncbi:MAG: deoxyribose-phosphate aldolase [Gammaproteobacteria bacterium]|nr:deoxyribose-phosphate aldolase [Gammaproteobacteria bacterium]